jgi:N-acetylglucosaminyl-diphospho-decaprenol L-rhamnosyltransferase
VKLAVIVVNYRTPERTIECLSSLATQLEIHDRVVVVDNASEDGSAERIKHAINDHGWNSWSLLIQSPVNGGFAAGNNLGIELVEADGYLLLNSDTVVECGAIARMRKAMESNPTVGLVAPWLDDGDGRKGVAAFRFTHPVSELIRSCRTGVISQLLRRYDVVLNQDETNMVQWVGFACVLIRDEVIKQVGMLDEGYFLYFEDIDFCRRAQKASWKIHCCPEARVIHHLGSSSCVTSALDRRRRAPRYYYESRARYFAKFYGLRGLWLANTLWILGRSLAWLREVAGNLEPQHRDNEAHDIWINAFAPVRNG